MMELGTHTGVLFIRRDMVVDGIGVGEWNVITTRASQLGLLVT